MPISRRLGERYSLLTSAAFSCFLLLMLLSTSARISAGEAESAQAQKVEAVAEQLQQRINAKRYLLDALGQLVKSNPDLSQPQFEQAAEDLMANHQDVIAVQLARDSVISHVYPLYGNEATLGHDLLEDAQRRGPIQRALNANQATLAGPYLLRQGGIGLVIRLPIFLDQGQTRLWGLAIVVMDWNPIAEQVGLSHEEGAVRYGLRSLQKDPASVSVGDSLLFSSPEAVIKVLQLPNAQWQLALKMERDAGVTDGLTILLSLFAGFGLLFSLLAMIWRHRHSWHAPATLSAALIAVSVAAVIGYHQVESRNERLQAVRAADHVRQLIYERVQDNQNYLFLLSQEYRRDQLDLFQFALRGGRFVQDHPELLNLNWVSRDLVIKEVTPRKDNAQILGLTISLDAPLEAALQARDSRSPAHTRLFKNIQGKYSFETWYPVYKGNAFRGLIVAVYDVGPD